MKLFAFAASHRKESINRKLARAAADMAEVQGATVTFAEYGEFDSPIYDDELFDENSIPESVNRFIEKLNGAKGIILASPEYNWSFPGSLKNLIDWVSVKNPNPLNGKSVLLLSASPSLRGGAEGLVQLRTPLSALGAFVYPKMFYLARAEALLKDNSISDERVRGDLQKLTQNFVNFTGTL